MEAREDAQVLDRAPAVDRPALQGRRPRRADRDPDRAHRAFSSSTSSTSSITPGSARSCCRRRTRRSSRPRTSSPTRSLRAASSTPRRIEIEASLAEIDRTITADDKFIAEVGNRADAPKTPEHWLVHREVEKANARQGEPDRPPRAARTRAIDEPRAPHQGSGDGRRAARRSRRTSRRSTARSCSRSCPTRTCATSRSAPSSTAARGASWCATRRQGQGRRSTARCRTSIRTTRASSAASWSRSSSTAVGRERQRPVRRRQAALALLDPPK